MPGMRRLLIALVLVVVVLFGVLYAIQVWPGSPPVAVTGAQITIALAAWAIRLLGTSPKN
jgi:hypothetical protein